MSSFLCLVMGVFNNCLTKNFKPFFRGHWFRGWVGFIFTKQHRYKQKSCLVMGVCLSN